MTQDLKRTPLYEEHQRLGAKLVGFAGWELPVRYSGVIEEHHAVRRQAGLFDICHMGEIFVSGPEAEAALQYLTCNDLKALFDGRAQYGAILNPEGGVVDDIIIYRLAAERYLVCVNAANAAKDFAWFKEHNRHGAEFRDCSAEYGLIALQGPRAVEILRSYCSGIKANCDLIGLKYFHCSEAVLGDISAVAARTGYTGEDGFEFFVPWGDVAALWQGLMQSGSSFGLVPVGLGARDSLRLEACYPLHGHELREDVSALESGLGWVIKFGKGDFIGREALLSQKERGLPRKLAGFFVDEPGIVREGSKLFSLDGVAVGVVTSGTQTPTLGKALGLALVDSGVAEAGQCFYAELRGKRVRCRVEKTPFYKRA